MSTGERYELPVTEKQHKLIKDALDEYYLRAIRKVGEKEDKSGKPRDVKSSQKLAFIQETVQYVTLVLNIKTNKLNEALANSFGPPQQDGTTDEEGASS